ncbi:hypothetical protein VB636_08825 [Paracoccus sp. APAP_BH8]|uniref:hypothetical protein n=1 Tax=Paracoccus sp. APAP_BH8 TaxID=3110237 RepID=UPI002FD87BD9
MRPDISIQTSRTSGKTDSQPSRSASVPSAPLASTTKAFTISVAAAPGIKAA